MPLSIACPHCAKGFVVAAELRGKKVRCKACQETFVVKEKPAPIDDPDEDEVSEMITERPQPSPRPVKKLKPASRFDEEDEERPRRRTKKRSARQSSSKVPILLIAGARRFSFSWSSFALRACSGRSLRRAAPRRRSL